MLIQTLFKKFIIGLALCYWLFFTACNNELDHISQTDNQLIKLPIGFPSINYPQDNQPTIERITLGKMLFNETALSIDSSISCASCHKVELAFADNTPTSKGVFGRDGIRNAPSLANVAYSPYFLSEGSVKTLEMQVLVPIQEHNEFNHNIIEIANILATDSAYQKMSRLAYNRRFDYYVLTRAIANYERSLLSGNSAFDKYKYQKINNALTESQKKGMRLFYSDKLACSKCHSDFSFTNYSFENNGLYSSYKDVGRFRLTSQTSDLAKFKVPTLRNIAFTAPYMHDGSLTTLSEVIEHYNSGGKDHPSKSEFIKPLHLSKNEKQYLLAFLESLSDYSFINKH